MTELTDEQKKFLEECEAEFSNRYTEEDKEFMQVWILSTYTILQPYFIDQLVNLN